MNNEIIVDGALILAALQCASSEETRPHICGVRLHAKDEALRIVATDGKLMFVADQALNGPAPEWLQQGVTIYRDGLDIAIKTAKRLNGSEMLSITCSDGFVHIKDRAGVSNFRLREVDGDFVDYSRVIPTSAFEPPSDTEVASENAFDSKQLKTIDAVARLVRSDLRSSAIFRVKVWNSQDGSPAVISLPRDGCVMVVMPMGLYEAYSPRTEAVLDEVRGRSVAALKAHRTRLARRLDTFSDKTCDEAKAVKAKIADYDARINGIDTADKPKVVGIADKRAAKEATSKPAAASRKAPADKAPAKPTKTAAQNARRSVVKRAKEETVH